MRNIALLAAIPLVLAWSSQAAAEGAIALGLPGDIAKGGVAIGLSWDEPTPQAAQQEALKWCRDSDDVPQATRSICKVVQTFRKRCVGVAIDPQPATTGFGWAVTFTSGGASGTALFNCKAAAGARARFCQVIAVECDQ